jgi:hypothetical protein
MAKLNMYEQQTTMGSVRSDPQTFGAGVGQAVAQAGGAMLDIGDMMMRRDEVLESAKMARELDEWGQQSLTTINDTDDISSPKTVAKFEAGMREKQAEMLSRFSGRSGARASLQASLENQVYQYTKSAQAAQIKAQHDFIASTVDQSANSLALKAAEAPGQIDNIFAEFDSQLSKLDAAMSPTVKDQYRAAGRAKLATSAVARLEMTNQYEAAKELMRRPDVSKYMSPDITRKFTIDIAVGEAKAQKTAADRTKRLQSWAVRMGGTLTPEQIIKIDALPTDKKDMTIADHITEYELVANKPVTQNIIDQFYKIEGGGGKNSMFGNSLQGRAIDFVTDNAIAYANGMLPPDQARKYEAAFNVAYEPKRITDPLTNTERVIQPTLPNFVKQAAEQGSRFYGGVNLTSRATSGGAMPGSVVQWTTPDGEKQPPVTVGADGTWVSKPAAPTQQPQPQQPTAQAGPSGDGIEGATLMDLAPLLTGVQSGIGRAVANAPFGIGDNIGNQDYTRAAARASRMIEEITGATKPETKIAEQYRQELRDLVDLGTKVWGSEGAYYARAVEIDKELRRKLAEMNKKIDGSTMTTLDERKAAVEIRNDIQAVLPQIGVPQLVVRATSKEDGLKKIEALPPGTRFRVGDDPTPYTR